MTPSVWMEARCAGIHQPGDTRGCHETVQDGCFSTRLSVAARHFRSQGWTTSDGEWWCPVCSARRRTLES